MLGSNPVLATLSLASLLVGLTAEPANAAPRHHAKGSRTARVVKPRACTKAPVEVVRGTESETFALAACDGSASPEGVDRLSLLTRASDVSRPIELASAAKGHGAEKAPAIRRLDPRLVERVERVVEHFRKDGSSPRIVLVQGDGQREPGARHAGMARGLDFRIDGVTGEALGAYCKTLSDTGCGFYPRDGHLRMEVRAPGSGHYAWVAPAASPQAGLPAAPPAAGDGAPTKLAPLPAASIAVPVANPADSRRFL